MKMKKFLSLALAMVMALSMSTIAFATEPEASEGEGAGLSIATDTITTSGQETTIPVDVTVEGTTFSVTVPTSLPAHVAADGTVTVASNCSIVNGSSASIAVSNVVVNVDEDWDVGNFEDDFSIKALNSKIFGLMIADVAVAEDGSYDYATAFPKINGGETRNFEYVLKLAPQTEELTEETIAEIVFTISWYNAADAEAADPAEPNP